MAEQTHQQHIVNADSIYINNKDDRKTSHIQIGTKGILGDNDLVLNNCNVEITSGGYVKAPEIRTAVLKDTAGNTTISLSSTAIDFHSKTINNLTLGSGAVSASSVSSANGYASLDAELDALTTNKVSITGHTASKIFVSSSGGGLTTSTINPADVTSAISKLSGIETSADVTDTANVTSSGALMDSELSDLAGVKGVTISTLQVKPSEGAFANGDKTKLDAIEASADVTDTANVTSSGALMDSELTDLAGVKGVTISTLQVKPSEGAFANGDKTKLDSALQNFNGLSTNTIEVGGGADKTANVDFKFVATAMNINPDDWKYITLRTPTLSTDKIIVLPSDAGTLQLVNGSGTIISDAERTKLNGIEASATADQTNAQIRTAIEAATDSNVFTDADHSKLNNIEATAQITNTANVRTAGALMDDEMTDLAGVKGVTISTLQVKPSEGAFVNGDKTKLDANATKLTGISYSSPATTIGNSNNKLIVDNAYVNTSTPGYEFNSSAFVLIKKPSSTTHWNMILDRGDNYWSGWKSSHHFDTYNSASKYSENATGATYFVQYYSHGDIALCYLGGNVGIRGATSYPLQVNSYSSTPDAAYRGIRYSDWYTNFGDMGTRTDYDTSDHGSNFTKTSIKSQYTIQCSALLIYSDKRIKENIRDISDNSSLQKLRDLPCVYYEYIDPEKGSGTEIGFIAQDVMEHIPLACSLTKEFIPNELRPIEPVWETITDLSGNETFKLTISDLDVSGNTKYRFLCSTGEKGEDIDLENLENEPKSFIFEKKWDKIFLYGKEVDDFHIIDKNKIFSIAFSATQEIDRIQQQHAIEIATLKQQLSNIENRLTAGNL